MVLVVVIYDTGIDNGNVRQTLGKSGVAWWRMLPEKLIEKAVGWP